MEKEGQKAKTRQKQSARTPLETEAKPKKFKEENYYIDHQCYKHQTKFLTLKTKQMQSFMLMQNFFDE